MLAVHTSNLKVSFNKHSQLSFPDWEIQAEDDAIILGPSGSGKTTLLHLLSGLLTPSEGEIVINGMKISQMKAAELDQFRRRQIGIVFQQPHLIKSLTVIENLMLARFLGNQTQDRQWVDEIVENLGLEEIRHQNAKKISQGQAQRVSIARAIINKPKVLFGDEPTASLDDENCAKVIALLKQEARLCNATLIIATHDHRVKREFGNQLQLDHISL